MSTASLLVLDSGLGGLSVTTALRDALPGIPLLYVADTAAFPYGKRPASAILAHVSEVLESVLAAHSVALIVVACNTLSTLALSDLRARFPLPFVGTVPAIKLAAQTHPRFTLLATQNTAGSAYSTDLITRFAAGNVVDRVGAAHLAEMAEAFLLGAPLDEKRLAQEFAPCFHDDAQGKTSAIVLGCTHYPFLLAQFTALAPWPVVYIDPAPAIARQAATLWHAGADAAVPHRAYVTNASDVARYAPVFHRFGFAKTAAL
jgi:glutamate racemase